MTEVNHYAVLGIRRSADALEIREAYVRRVKHTHPDLDQRTDYPKPRLEDLQRAYHCLRDADARSAHDAALAAAEADRAARLRRMQRRLARRGDRSPPLQHPSLRRAIIARRWRMLLLLGVLTAASMRMAGL